MGLALKTSGIAQAKTWTTFQDHSLKYIQHFRQKIQYTKNQEFKLWKQVQAIDMGSALVAQWICTCEGDKGALLTI